MLAIVPIGSVANLPHLNMAKPIRVLHPCALFMETHLGILRSAVQILTPEALFLDFSGAGYNANVAWSSSAANCGILRLGV